MLVISDAQEGRWVLHTPFLLRPPPPKKIIWSNAVDSESLTNLIVRSVTKRIL